MTPTGSSPRRAFQLLREVQLQRLRRVLENELSPIERRAVEDYYFKGMRIPAMAARYGVNTSTVSRTLHRARKRLHRFLQY